MSGKKRNAMLFVLLFTLLLGVIVPVQAQSYGGTKTIRVAYREDADFINKSSSGVYKGYGVEYLNKISQYTGWRYEYINESWENQLADLKSGKVDLICNAQKTEAREKDYDFSCMPVGTEQAGFRILMDDFGSGYSSLNMLKEAPVDEIKLDMRFLSAADPYGRAEEILHMIITMGNHMKLSIIAEGVETEQQKVMLQGFGCNKAQGYFYARPMREAEYTELLRKEKAEN